MNDPELQAWVEEISLRWFGMKFRHQATFNSRLRSTGGRYFMKSHNIEINPKQLKHYGLEETEKIIKHELCHYHLHLLGRGYQHKDPDFKTLLKKVGGSRFCQSLPGAEGRRTLPYRYELICQSCGLKYPRKRKVDAKRYRCGKCAGKLKLFSLPS
ncbi:SprT family protein [Paenibacillus physcomitrellae]|uniref:Protein SprT-like n=1 Tax=Paenibacillus physcomitrellae TaxID=1619311 RepID=A0ABQ1G5U4_9BACL|nr:SprT family protein [Paenibacillus physcomitrellae]GGA37228.1 protein SprT [Paenibacillus physcomitrellae]